MFKDPFHIWSALVTIVVVICITAIQINKTPIPEAESKRQALQQCIGHSTEPNIIQSCGNAIQQVFIYDKPQE